MKKVFFLTVVIITTLAVFQGCRRDPKITPHVQNPGDPDSLYAGKTYASFPPSLQNGGPFSFGTIRNPYHDSYKDSITVEGIQLGRRLFYDKHFSLDGQKSCASCHKLQYALSDMGNALSTNEFGLTKRNAPAIQNLAWAAPYLFWDGRQPTLAAQAGDAFQHELGFNPTSAVNYLQADSIYVALFKKAFGRPGTITVDKINLGLEQFMMSAISSNSRFDSIQRGQAQFTASEYNGFANIFQMEKGDCFHCHAFGQSYLMTDNMFHNNGLDTASSINSFKDPGRGGITGVTADYGLFRTPSIRNLQLTGPYMHDGRFQTLEQVIDFYSDNLNNSVTADVFIQRHMDKDSNGVATNHGGMHLTTQEKQDLLNFLYTLQDNVFINNPALKDPF